MAAFTEEEMQRFSMAKWYDLSGRVAIVTGGATGLGLAICKAIMDRHGQSIRLKNGDGGCEFEITLERAGR